jgi:SAM-dependent methyltransferase
VTGVPSPRYAFGDGHDASLRLALLADVFAPTSETLLSVVSGVMGAGTAPGDGAPLVVDLGCGPGHTTAMLARAVPGAFVVGVDASLAFLTEARARRPARGGFVRADVCAPLPVRSPSLVYARFLLAHLPAPAAVALAWAASLSPGGVLVLEEPERIDTEDDDIRRYLELAATVVAARGADLYAGRHLHGVAWPPGWRVVVDRLAALEVSMGDAAAMFVPNLRTWAHDPSLKGRTDTAELDLLATRLGARLDDDRLGAIRWHLRQVVTARPA